MRSSMSTFRNAGSSSLRGGASRGEDTGLEGGSQLFSYDANSLPPGVTPSQSSPHAGGDGSNLNLYSHEGQGRYPDPYNRHGDQGTIVAPRSFLPAKTSNTMPV